MNHNKQEFVRQGTNEMDFRRPFLVGLMVFMLIFLVWHTIAESLFGFGSMAVLEGTFALYSAALLYLVMRRPYSTGFAVGFVVPALIVVVVAMFHPGTPSNVFVWVFMFPVITYFLLGRQLGMLLTLLCSLLALAAYLTKSGEITVGRNFLVISDEMICLFIIWVIAHLYERYRERTVETLHLLATTDELTGLQNRRQMEKAFNHLSVDADRQKHALAVVAMDLDHFKNINDRWGHNAGDAVLVHVANLLHNSIRKSDWAFRIGGEEFCLLLQVDGHKGAITAAETIRHLIASTPCRYEREMIALSASIGVALYPEENGDFEKLLQRADKYMYQAKRNGRNQVVAGETLRDNPER